MKTKTIFLLAGILIVVMILLLCSNNPSSESSPDKARVDIGLRSSGSDSGSVIIDTVNKRITVFVSFEYGYFIDSVCLSIYSGTAAQHSARSDSDVVVRFGPDDPRENLEISVSFAVSGDKYFLVQAFRHNAGVVTASASARIIPLKSGNHPPKFNQNTPNKVYIVKRGDPVVIQVSASDLDGEDTIRFAYNFDGKTFPRGEKGVLANGVFQWQPQPGDQGLFYIVFSAADQDTAVLLRTTIALDTSFNTPPEIKSKAPTTVRTRSYYEYRPDVEDPEGGVLTWQLSGKRPENLFFDSLYGKILWYAQGDIGSLWSMVLKVTDNGTPPQSDSQQVSITVVSASLPPVAEQGIGVATGSNKPVEIKLSAKDPDDTQLTFIITEPPDSGSTVFKTNDVIVYTPKSGFKGVDTIRFVARDAVQSSDTAKVLVYVAWDNQRPVAIAEQITTQEDSSISFTLNARDVEAAQLTYTIGRKPLFGSLSGTAADQKYTPNSNFFGTDTVTFMANDGSLISDPAMVIIKVLPVNDAPVAQVFGTPTAVGAAVTFNLVAQDPDDSVFTFEFIVGPRNGILDSTRLPRLVYMPNSDFKGVDSIVYRAVDAHGLAGVPARIAILVGIDNSPPVAEKQTVNVNEDAEVAITLRGSDIETPTLLFKTSAQPKNGTLSGSGALQTYRPYANFSGADTFSFTVDDGVLVSQQAFVVVNVAAVNDLPVGAAQTVTTGRNLSSSITLSARDVDDSLFSFRIVESPRHGTLDTTWIKIGRIQYTPGSNYTGGDTIRFIARDLTGGESQPAVVAIVISQENQKPVANPQNVTFVEDETRPIFLTGSDFESSNLLYSITQQPLHGQLEGALPAVSYKTNRDYNGADTFYFTVDDGNLKSDPARIAITIAPVNDPPTAKDLVASTKVNESVGITLDVGDVDDPVSSLTCEVTAPHHGTVDLGNIKNAKLSYTPATGYSGNDTIVYRVLDAARLSSGNKSIIITVVLDNQPPVAYAQNVSLREDEQKTILLTGKDPEGKALTFAVPVTPKNGVLDVSQMPNIRYTPFPNWSGSDSVKFTASDGSLTSVSATVLLVVQPVNDPPVGNIQSIATQAAATVFTVLTGSDVDNSSGFTYSIAKTPTHGTLDVSGLGTARIGYTPAANFQGRDTVLFVVRDVNGAQSAPTPLIIAVALDNQKPVATPKQVSTAEDVPASIALSGSDPEGAVLTYAIYANPRRGSVTLNGATVLYQPNLNANGSDTFMVTASDGLQSSEPARVAILVSAVNDTPVANPLIFPVVTEDVAKSFLLSGIDADGNALTYNIVGDPSHGSITGSLPNGVYNPAANYNGPDAFTFIVSDSSLSSSEITVTITVSAVNDTPAAIAQSGIPVKEDSVVVVVLGGTDVESSSLTAGIAMAPIHGIATLTGNSVSYRPFSNYGGLDSLRFTMSDGSLVSTQKTIGFVVDPVNDAPVVGTIADQSILLGGSFSVINLDNAVADTDNADNAIDWTSSATTNLNVSISALHLATVTVVSGVWSGSETVTFTATDPGGLTDATTVQFTVSPNTPPTITSIADRTIQMNGNTGAITFTIDDAQTAAASLTLARASSNLTLVPVAAVVFGGSGANRTVTVTPAAGTAGSATITLTVSDGIASTIEEFVLKVNAPPSAGTGAVVINEDTEASGTLTGTDPEGGPLTYTVTAMPQHGTLAGSAPAYTYIPTQNYNGPDSILFTVTDNTGAVSTPAKVSISLTPVNDPPVAIADTFHVATGGEVSFTQRATDVDGDALTFSKPSSYDGTVGGTPPNLTFLDITNLPGSVPLLFTVSDGHVAVPGTITIIIDP